MKVGVYGDPPARLAPAPDDVTRFSPFDPMACSLEDEADGGFDSLIVAAPAASLERRYVLAQALRVAKPGAEMLALGRKDRGGARLVGELADFGCTAVQRAKAHHKLCHFTRPANPSGLNDAIGEGGPQIPNRLGLWSQPGLFSWDRIDAGSALLAESLPSLAGKGIDLGCGYGVLSRAALKNDAVSELLLVDADSRAIAAARRNVYDPRARFLHGDARDLTGDVDFCIVNPPFHVEGREDRSLGEALARTAVAMLRRGGVCLLVANVALPYEKTLQGGGATVRELARRDGFKVLEARR